PLLGGLPGAAAPAGPPDPADDQGQGALPSLRVRAWRHSAAGAGIRGRAGGGAPGRGRAAARAHAGECPLAQRGDRGRGGAGRGVAADRALARGVAAMTADAQKTRAAEWFESLRDRLTAALEAVEDEYAARQGAAG